MASCTQKTVSEGQGLAGHLRWSCSGIRSYTQERNTPGEGHGGGTHHSQRNLRRSRRAKGTSQEIWENSSRLAGKITTRGTAWEQLHLGQTSEGGSDFGNKAGSLGGHSRGLLLRSDQGHPSRLARPSFKHFTYSCHLTHRAARGNTVSPNNTDGILGGLAEATRATKGGTEVTKSGQAKKPGFLGLHATEHHARKGAGGGGEREAGREGAPRGERPRRRGTRRREAVGAGKTGTGLRDDRKVEQRLPE